MTDDLKRYVTHICADTEQKLIGILDFDTSMYAFNEDTGPRVREENAKINLRDQLDDIAILISAMKILGASNMELKRAIEHSYVLIDCKKNLLDWKQSEKDQGITELEEKYMSEANEYLPWKWWTNLSINELCNLELGGWRRWAMEVKADGC